MEWPRDNDYLNPNKAELKQIFQYDSDSRPTTVIRITESNRFEAQVCLLESSDEWDEWLDYTESPDRGIMIILSNREVSKSAYKSSSDPSTIEDWLSRFKDDVKSTTADRQAETFATLGEKPVPRPSARPKSLRSLSFSQDTFRSICERFCVHQSIIRTIARTDVPNISCESVDMQDVPAFVYNARTSKAWPSDLALSATYFPEKGQTFAIIYGTNPTIEKDILTKLKHVRGEAGHPLLPLGLLAELELSRHIRLVESHIITVETKIFELNFQSGDNALDVDRTEVDRKNREKRRAWLNLSYLRNSLTTWSTQLAKVVDHVDVLNARVFTPLGYGSIVSGSSRKPLSLDTHQRRHPQNSESSSEDGSDYHIQRQGTLIASDGEGTKALDDGDDSPLTCDLHQDLFHGVYSQQDRIEQIRKVGARIQVRVAAIRDEYDEKIRDCTMRVDGMAMATQWAQGETAVEISLATNQDSKVMRSISLVTMIFLPGTFFATVFSMTFFDWGGSDGKTRISRYLWVYVTVTVFFTMVTIGLWYFFVIFRKAGRRTKDEEMAMADR